MEYSFNNGEYILNDRGVSFKEVLSYPSWPDKLEACKDLGNGLSFCILKDKEDRLLRAYYTLKGLVHGKMLFYDEKQQEKGYSHYKDGELHGPSRFFSPNGTLLSESWFIEGLQQGRGIQNYLDEKPYGRLYFINGKQEGLQEYFYPNGQLKTQNNYQEGLLEGKTQLFYENGQLFRDISYKKGKRVGKEQMFAEDGSLLEEVDHSPSKEEKAGSSS